MPLRTSRHLALRNLLAERILAALAERDGVCALRELPATLRGQLDREPGELARARARVARGCAVAGAYWAHRAEAGEGLDAALVKSALLFRAGLFFEVHEVLEQAWRDLEGDTRRLVQGLIQLAVGIHHLAHGNAGGARSLLAAGRAKVAPHAPEACGVQVGALLAGLEPFEDAATEGRPWPAGTPLPALLVRAPSGRVFGEVPGETLSVDP